LELIERIGSGGYGEVWLCRNVVGTLRAVKVVRRAEFDDERPYEREFNGIRKFEPISRTHEGFVNILQIGRNEPEGFFYYVMELADRLESADIGYSPRTLASELKSKGALPLPEVLHIAQNLARALAELHRYGLVHRDIKPSNIIFVNGAPKLADIGLVASVTDSRSFVGTEGFIPPEGPGTIRADIYSLGIVLYVMATGKHHRDFPEPPANLATLLPADRNQLLELTAIIHKACQTNPRDRYQTADPLLADLELFRSGHSVKRRHTLQRSWSSTWKIAVALSFLLIASVALKNVQQRRAFLREQSRPPWQKSGTTNVAAWEAGERAWQMGSTFTAVGHSNAISELERALVLDSNYRDAWIQLASSYSLAANNGFMPAKAAMQRCEECVQNVLNLSPSDPGAIFFLGDCVLALTYDFHRAEALYRKAISLDPKFTILRQNFALNLTYYGHFQEAQTLVEQVLRENPSNAGARNIAGRNLAAQNRLEPALKEVDAAILLMPDRPSFRLFRAQLLWSLGRRQEAAEEHLRFVQMNGYVCLNSKVDSFQLAQTLAGGGPKAFLTQLIQRLEMAHDAGRFVSENDLANLHAQAGHQLKALDWLEKSVDEHRPLALGAKYNPVFNELREEPRFHGVLRRLKLEE
jgi:serine/threonine protein kinase